MRPDDVEASTGGWHRLHPTSLIFRLGKQARALLLPGVAVMWLAREGSWEIWLMVLFVPSTIFELTRYFTLRYRFARDELIVRHGLVFRNERHVPFTRIQNIDLVQSAAQRLAGVADVKLETASGVAPEAVLSALSLAAVDEMRRRVFEDRAAGPEPLEGAAAAPPRPDPALILRLRPKDLVLIGLIWVRGLALVAVALGAAWEFDLLEKVDVEAWFEQITEEEAGGAPRPLVVAGVLAIALATILLLSVAWSFLRLYGFRLVRDGEDLRLSCGLLTRFSATVPRPRIQFITVRQSFLHRLFRRLTVRIETAGGKREGGESSHALGERYLVPLAEPDRLAEILEHIRPGLDIDAVAWQPLHPRARRRMIKRAIIVATVLSAAALGIAWPWGGLAFIALGPLLVWHAVHAARYARWSVDDGGVHFRSGVLTRKRSTAPIEKIQVLALHETPFDRRAAMRTLHIDTAGAGSAGHRISIRYLPAEVAQRLFDDLARSTECATFTW